MPGHKCVLEWFMAVFISVTGNSKCCGEGWIWGPGDKRINGRRHKYYKAIIQNKDEIGLNGGDVSWHT